MEYRLENIKIPVPKGDEFITFKRQLLHKLFVETGPNAPISVRFGKNWYVVYKTAATGFSLPANTNDRVFRYNKPKFVQFTGWTATLMYKSIMLATYSYENKQLWIQYNYEGYDVTDILNCLVRELFDIENVNERGYVRFNTIVAPRGTTKTSCELSLGTQTWPSKFNKAVSAKQDYMCVSKDNLVLYDVKLMPYRLNVLKLDTFNPVTGMVEPLTYIDGGEVGLW